MPTTLTNLSGTFSQRGQCLLGFITFLTVAFLIGRRHGKTPIPWRTIFWGIGLQFIFALIVLRTPQFLEAINAAISALLGFTRDGARMVFGNLIDNFIPLRTGPDYAAPTIPNSFAQTGSIFAFFVLPTIIFFSALTAILYHTGIMQLVVQGLATIMRKSMRTSGAETLSAAANIFVGQTEAPLMIKPFLLTATRSELLCIMIAGFANIATGVLGVYTGFLQSFITNAGGHLAAACFISAPAALLVSKLLLPETSTPTTAGGLPFKIDRIDANILDATTRGTFEGLRLAVNVGAMLIAFTALVALLNGLLGWFCLKIGVGTIQNPATLQQFLGYLLYPVAWLTGIPASECHKVGSLIGIKTILNEFIAYADLSAAFRTNPVYLSPRSALLTTYALCGFANLASIGIQIGGISSLAPERRADLSKIALTALLGGALTSHLTACIIGMLV